MEIIDDNYEGLQDIILPFKTGHAKEFLRNL